VKGLILQGVVHTQFLLISVRADSVARFSGLVYNSVMFVIKAKVFMKVRQKYLCNKNRNIF